MKLRAYLLECRSVLTTGFSDENATPFVRMACRKTSAFVTAILPEAPALACMPILAATIVARPIRRNRASAIAPHGLRRSRKIIFVSL
jgi:hypothetical protein